MPLIIVVILALFIPLLFPRLATTIAWLLTLAFIIPFFTFVGGTFVWAIANIFTKSAFFGWGGWWGFCAFAGLPMGLAAAWWVHSD